MTQLAAPRLFGLSIRPTTERRLLRITAAAAFALLTALAAQVAVPVPGSPVPITLQSLAVVLAGLTLGARLGAASMAIYLLIGALGLPVYADQSGGVHVLFGATGGYLLGFIAAQPVLAAFTRTRSGAYAGHRRMAAGVVAAHAVIFALGLLWLKAFSAADWPTVLQWGLWPYLLGGAIKAAIAVAAGTRLAPAAARRRW